MALETKIETVIVRLVVDGSSDRAAHPTPGEPAQVPPGGGAEVPPGESAVLRRREASPSPGGGGQCPALNVVKDRSR